MNEGLTIGGAVLLIVGIVLLFIPFVCLGGIVLAIVGFILMLVGIVQEEPRPAYGYPPMYVQPAYPPYPVAMPPSQPGQPAPATQPGGTPHCPRCGQLLRYVYEYQRWYCQAENVYPWG